MTAEERKRLVASLLEGAAGEAQREAEALLQAPDLTPQLVARHLRAYILAKYLLPADCREESITELASLSLQRTMKLDAGIVHELDKAAPCNHATSESTKKVLLLYAIQKDLSIHPAPQELTEAATVSELAQVVYEAMLRERENGH
ncbi:MAG: hypothetical protein LUE06_04795 [Oscillospiraceae bacterium]|nr:hypothetical protein [Oscillospiraceae bacterium]